MKDYEEIEREIEDLLIQDNRMIPRAFAIKALIWTLIRVHHQNPTSLVVPLLENQTRFQFDDQIEEYSVTEIALAVKFLQKCRDLILEFSN